MADEKKEPWLNLLALTTVILAVCATLATFKGGGYSTRSVMSQAQASDQWAFFQAKSVKANLYEINRDQLELEATAAAPARAEELRRKAEEFGKKVARYEKEKEEIQAVARQKEQVRDEAQKHSGAFGLAVIFLQISILLSSIAALLKKQPVWWLGLVIGAVGIVCFLNGFWLFLKV
jgi:cation transport ATPase